MDTSGSMTIRSKSGQNAYHGRETYQFAYTITNPMCRPKPGTPQSGTTSHDITLVVKGDIVEMKTIECGTDEVGGELVSLYRLTGTNLTKIRDVDGAAPIWISLEEAYTKD